MKKLVGLLMTAVLVLSTALSCFPEQAAAAAEEDGYVYLSISNDEKYVTSDPESGNPGRNMIYVPVKISDFKNVDLQDYGLEDYACDFYFDEEGNQYQYDSPQTPTLLQLFIYSMEEYCQEGWNVTVTGGKASLYLANGFWHHDENLLYYVNGQYPLFYKGWGATCSGILLKPGDFVDVTMYSDWNFYQDSAAGFHYFLDEDGRIAHTLTAAPNRSTTLKLGRAMGNISGGEETSIKEEANYTVYIQSASGGENVEPDPEKAMSFTTDDKGEFTIPDGLQAGTYDLWAYGGYGADAITEDAIVSSPAYCRLVVCDHEGGTADCVHKAVCAKCGEEYGRLDGSNHGETIHLDAKAPTCGDAGYAAHDVCSRCGKALESFTEYPATGNHSLNYVACKKAEMGVPGNIAHYKCAVCGKKFKDAAGKEEAKSVVIPQIMVHEHEKCKTITKKAKAASCTEDGWTEEIRCTYPDCDYVFQESTALLHTGHKLTYVEAKAATSTEYGNIAYYRCENCSGFFKDEKGDQEISEADTLIEKLPAPQKQEKAQVKLNASSIRLKVKQTTSAVKATVGKGDQVKSWKSSNTKIATVTKAGKITAKKVGKCTLTVTTKKGAKAVLKLTVQKTAVGTTKITASKVSVKKGKTVKISYKRTPITCVQKISYRSANPKIAKVSAKGVVKGVKRGSTTVTLKSGKKSVKVKIVVK